MTSHCMRLAVLVVFALALGTAPMAQPLPSAPADAEHHVPAPSTSYSLSYQSHLTVRADLTGAHLARVASEREVAGGLAAFAHEEVVVLVMVSFHGCERRLLDRDRDPFVVVTEAHELRNATDGCFVVVLHLFVRE